MNDPISGTDILSKEELKYINILATVPFVGMLIYFFYKDAGQITKSYAKQSNWPLILGISAIFFILL